jgi:hypothetical protein
MDKESVSLQAMSVSVGVPPLGSGTRRFSFFKTEMTTLRQSSTQSPVSRSDNKTSVHRLHQQPVVMSWQKQVNIIGREEADKPTSSRHRRQTLVDVCRSERSGRS